MDNLVLPTRQSLADVNGRSRPENPRGLRCAEPILGRNHLDSTMRASCAHGSRAGPAGTLRARRPDASPLDGYGGIDPGPGLTCFTSGLRCYKAAVLVELPRSRPIGHHYEWYSKGP